MGNTKVGYLQVKQSSKVIHDPELPKLTDTGSCFIDPRNEEQIAAILEDTTRETKEITEEIPTGEYPVADHVLEDQLLELVAEAKRVHELLEEMTSQRNMLFDRFIASQNEIAGLRELIDQLTRKLASKEP